MKEYRSWRENTADHVMPESQDIPETVRRRADRIASLIIASDYPAIDIVIEIRKLHSFVESHMPEKVRLFEMVYESRFRRLWRQFRQDGEGPLPEW